jgi:hypothetical protein
MDFASGNFQGRAFLKFFLFSVTTRPMARLSENENRYGLQFAKTSLCLGYY